ncbi:Uncharacterised protein [Mycobacteroides abscessus subsp. abscessus]|nr:Uncharacterised protein [Mycobacteroides abscessus subsp. abscessus]
MDQLFTCPLDGCDKAYTEEWKFGLHCQSHERQKWLPVQQVPNTDPESEDAFMVPPFKERRRA